MNNFGLTNEGIQFIRNSERGRDGLITTSFYKKLILIYLLCENPIYEPDLLKDNYVELLKILNHNDRRLMKTRNYPIWKHRIDSAKQSLLNFLTNNQNGTFSISDKHLTDAYALIIDYVAPLTYSLPEFRIEKNLYQIKYLQQLQELFAIRLLSNKIKEEQDFKCQI